MIVSIHKYITEQSTITPAWNPVDMDTSSGLWKIHFLKYKSAVHLTLPQNLDSPVRISRYGSIKTLEIETLDTVGTPRYRVYGRTPSELEERGG